MARSRLPPVLALTVLFAGSTGCFSYDQADLTRYAREQNFPVSPEPPPTGTTVIGIAHIEQDGFYILGSIPILSVSLQSCLDEMVKAAKKIGADGMADVCYRINSADVLKFSVFPLPDWSANIAVTGTAYKYK